MINSFALRAWDHYVEAMITWDDILHGEVSVYTLFEDPKRITPLRFSGISDKNGNPIYEGDIMEVKALDTGDTIRYEVKLGEYIEANDEFQEPCLGWYLEGTDYSINLLQEYQGERQVEKYLAVVGNIFEHPELMEA